ncbi:INTS5 [Cordylochernes scorpioides]|uniref:INTS5 n=1 Tax=Cordylochernes scorpioides TaxID=51811 RepID=A0ABY6KSP4_9ARAC|nr:INTS5 [Cordylochernes scorpioides]
MSQPSTSQQPSLSSSDITPPLILHELDVFLKGASHSDTRTNIKVAKSAIYLLKVLPSSHDAVLEYMFKLFDDAVGSHVLHPEGPHEEEPVIHELLQVFSGFLAQRPKMWAPTLTSWSLGLLGNLSAKYASQDRSGLPQSLHFWTECPPTRALIDLSHACLAAMISANVEPCLATLLETSVQYSPHFDWVVAHLASCFPQTVISRVLAAGLKDFAQGDVKAKVGSVVGILEHLIAHHAATIRDSLVHMFYSSLVEHPSREQLSIIPYILNLAALSPQLAAIIIDEFIKAGSAKVSTCAAASKPGLLTQLQQRWPQWRSAPGTEDLLTLCRNLAADSEPLVRTLLNMATHRTAGSSDAKDQNMFHICFKSMLTCGVCSSGKCCQATGSCRGSLRGACCQETRAGVPPCCSWCVCPADLWPPPPLWMTCWLPASWGVVSESLSKVFSSNGRLLCLQVEMAYTLLTGLAVHRADLPISVISQLLSGPRLEKLFELVRLNPQELCPQQPEVLSELVLQNPAPHTMGLLALACQPEAMGPVAFIKAAQATVRYFFHTIAQPHNQPGRLRQLRTAQKLLAALSQQTAAQQAILRQLLSEALSPQNCKYFGSTVPEAQPASNMSLLRENSNIAISITLPQSHSSVFHAGVIGEGLRHTPSLDPLPEVQVTFNRQVLLDTVQSCCRPSWRFPSDKITAPASSLVSGMKTVSLLLVELISPDVMFNGLPWPDDDFQKVRSQMSHIETELLHFVKSTTLQVLPTQVTIERDLHIKRQFELHPVLWDLLELVAAVPPSLCYCSVLLRAHAALLIQYWGSCQSDTPTAQLTTTCRLLGLLSAGQLLPPPLGQVGPLVSMLTPWELHCVLSDIWQYMRDNVPSPALFRSDTMTRADPTLRCPPHYTQRLRHILLANIQRFGAFYAKLFPITSPAS